MDEYIVPHPPDTGGPEEPGARERRAAEASERGGAREAGEADKKEKAPERLQASGEARYEPEGGTKPGSERRQKP